MFTRADLLAKYNQRVPRYTSYPTALQFSSDFNESVLENEAKQTVNKDLSIYVHIPFCQQLCFYCGCSKTITRHQFKADDYLDVLEKEILGKKPLFSSRNVSHIHLGGGTPNFLSADQMRRLTLMLTEHFHFDPDLEYSVECDPRHLDKAGIENLIDLGVTRISIGVQDTNLKVQEAINRVQDSDSIRNLVDHAHKSGIGSVNLDLIYGLPFQTVQGFKKTIQEVLEMKPDRISLFNYAHLPERFPAQRKIKQEWLPSVIDKLSLMQLAHKLFCQAGFQAIGLDHFSLPNDPLTKAWESRKLHRNFQGYTTDTADVIGLGASSISQIGGVYCQNAANVSEYSQMMQQSGSAVMKGYEMSQDDLRRRFVISELMCNMRVEKHQFFNQFGVEFDHYFAQELVALEEFEADGLLELNQNNICLSDTARLFTRNICAVFDAYLKQPEQQKRYSLAL